MTTVKLADIFGKLPDEQTMPICKEFGISKEELMAVEVDALLESVCNER